MLLVLLVLLLLVLEVCPDEELLVLELLLVLEVPLVLEVLLLVLEVLPDEELLVLPCPPCPCRSVVPVTSLPGLEAHATSVDSAATEHAVQMNDRSMSMAP